MKPMTKAVKALAVTQAVAEREFADLGEFEGWAWARLLAICQAKVEQLRKGETHAN